MFKLDTDGAQMVTPVQVEDKLSLETCNVNKNCLQIIYNQPKLTIHKRIL